MAHSAWAPALRNRFPSSATVRTDTRLFDGPEGQPLRLALDDVYRAFANVRLDVRTFEVCPHCLTPEDRDYLLGTPLLDLTWSDIAFVATKGTTALGSPGDFGYFLPRILEGLVVGIHYRPEVLPSKLVAGRPAWSADQAAAVAAFVNALEVVVHATIVEGSLRKACNGFVLALRNRLD